MIRMFPAQMKSNSCPKFQYLIRMRNASLGLRFFAEVPSRSCCCSHRGLPDCTPSQTGLVTLPDDNMRRL
ncbi:hypothetical protein ABKN59_004246 [Abortiporus biennis]